MNVTKINDGSEMDVFSVPTKVCTAVAKLKQNDDALISFYIAETKSLLTKQLYNDIKNIEVVIDEAENPYFEIVGRYDLREIAEEIKGLLENNSNFIGDFRELLDVLLRIIWEILQSEPSNDFLLTNQLGVNGEPFNIPNFSFRFISRIRDLEGELKSIIDQIRRMLNEGQWSARTRRLIEDILNRTWPKIVGRKRASIVLGNFSASKKQITLFKVAIENWLPDVDYFDKLLDVYSHELFHAFHYINMKNHKKWEYDENSRIVKESLARYIEYRYGLLNICDTAISSDLIRMWNDYDMHDFPYAGAKYVEKYIGLCELMFKVSVNNGTHKAFHLIDSAYDL